ncbi:WD repeat-containing protein 89 homolog [Antedon mediterranea]|uniref:WD repeat-containing protein 89 homolog n=1 Tax=Antedon mediterranea TaxID=105859 RepID=UPI003AF721EA
MFALAGVTGAGVARNHPRSAGSEMSSTPRSSSVLSIPASLRSEVINSERRGKRKDPVAEGNMRILSVVECHETIMCCKYNEMGKLLAVGFVDGSIKVYSGETGSILYSLGDHNTQESHLPCTSINFKPHLEGDRSENHLLATYASGMVKLWHMSTGQCLHTSHEARQTLTAAYNQDATLYVTGGSDTKLNVYDTTTGQICKTCEPSPSVTIMDGHRFRVFSIKFHPHDNASFVSGGWDDTVQFWNTTSEHSIRKLNGPHICGDALDIDPHHNHVVTGSWRTEYNLQIWDYSTGALIKNVPQDYNNSLLYCAQWLGKDHILVGGCEANLTRIVDRGTLQTTGRLADLPRGVYCLDNNRQGNVPKFAAGSDRSLFFLDMKQD